MMIVGLCLKVADVDETKRIRFAFRAMVAPLRIVEVGERQTPREIVTFSVFSGVQKEVIKKKKRCRSCVAGCCWSQCMTRGWFQTQAQASASPGPQPDGVADVEGHVVL